MLVQKTNLLQRVRVVMIALVAVIGFGTMAMKPADKAASNTYGVAETAGGENWEIRANVTGQEKVTDYDCNQSPKQTACTVHSDEVLSDGTIIAKDASLVVDMGAFDQ